MKRRKFLALLLTLVLALSLTACGGDDSATTDDTAGDDTTEDTTGGETTGDVVTFTISTDAQNRVQYCEALVDGVYEASGGRIQGEVLAANSLGTCNDMCQMLQLGTLSMMLSDDMSVDSNLNGALGFAWLPGLVSNREEADMYYDHGWIADKCAEIMLENGLVRFGSFTNGFRQVGNIVRPITEMSDLAGLKIRTPSVSSIVDFYEDCGALPVMIAGGEVLSALQTGTVDGLDNAVYNYINQGLTDVITYICEMNYCYSGGSFIAGTPFWDTLSEEDQEIFRTVGDEVGRQFTEDFYAETERLTQEGIDNGQWEVTQPSEAMQAELEEIYANIWEESRALYGDEIIDILLSGEYKTLSEAAE